MLKFFLWLRYLRKKRIVFLSIAAVAVSVSLLVVVASLFTGFINTFEQSAVDCIGEVIVVPPMRFSNYGDFIQRLEERAFVEAATPTLFGQGLLHLGAGNVRAVHIWGIEPESRAKVTAFRRFLMKGKNAAGQLCFELSQGPEATGGFVGIGVLAEPDEQTDEYDIRAVENMLGTRVLLTTGTVTGQDRRQGIKRKVIPFTIKDVVFTGVYDLDKRFIYLPIEVLQKALYPEESGAVADQIQIKLTAGFEAEAVAEQIKQLWRSFAQEQLKWNRYLIEETTVTTARQMQSMYIAELRKQMGLLLVIFGVVSLSVVMLIFCIFYMMVMMRQKDIAIVKSCGGASGSVAWLFIGFGGFVGMIGSAFGVIAGYAVTKNINTIEQWVRIVFGLKLWKSSVYMFSRIPNEVAWMWVAVIVSSAVVAAGAGALIPAIIAARTRPVNILRYE